MAHIDITKLSEETAEKIAAALIEVQEEELALAVLRVHGDKAIVARAGNTEREYPDYEYPNYDHGIAAQEVVDDGEWGDERTITVSTWDRWQLGDVTLDDESSRQTHSIELPLEA